MKSISIEQLNRIAGYVGAGEGEPVTYSQDDATRTWCVKVGGSRYYGDSLGEAFDKALKAADEYHANAYDMKPARGPEDI